MTVEEICVELDALARGIMDRIAAGEEIANIGAEMGSGAIDLTYKNLRQMGFIREEIEKRVVKLERFAKKLKGG